MIKKDLKDKLIEISKRFDLDLLILFGSRANGNSTKDSDWDLAYLSFKNNVDKYELYYELEKVLINVDLVNLLDNISILLKKEIFENGILIYEKKNGLFEDKALDVYFEYMDELDYLKEYFKHIENKLGI